MAAKFFEAVNDERRRLKAEYGQLFEASSALLFRHDPAKINFGSNRDEYDSEVGTILPRLRECRSATDARRVVHEEFRRWFDAETAGPEEKYAAIASELWTLWVRLRDPQSPKISPGE